MRCATLRTATMTDQRRSTGQRGEAIAANYLRQRGYGIIATNWRCPEGELDIVALDGSTLVFVEVRTRRGGAAGQAEESVTRAKQRRLIVLAEAYLQRLEDAQQPWKGAYRIDVVAIRMPPQGGNVRVHHLLNAVEAW